MMSGQDTHVTPRRGLDRVRRFVRDYTGGLDVRAVPSELSRDASRAYSILTRERADEPVPRRRLARLWHRTRILFLGMSEKLAPPRRMLFVACLVIAVVGLYLFEMRGTIETYGLGHPLVLVIMAIAGLVFLLALELADRVLVRDELEVARQLQRDLLPERPPAVAGTTFSFSYRTANTIGGDYYDFLPLADGRLALVIGDASGHGMAAGLLMAIANSSLQLAIDLDPSPGAVADLVNRTLYRTGGSRAFMTLFYGVFNSANGRLEYLCAGHPFPVVRRADGELVELGSGGLPLGLRPSISQTTGAIELAAGDLLVMFTDGIPEAVNRAGDAFGFERLRGLVAGGGTPGEVHDRIMTTLDGFIAGGKLYDDCSLVIVQRTR
jgi:serine phosphatase RsbU (regulator of sigma subunit)